MENENSKRPAYPVTEEITDRMDSGVKIYSGLTKRELLAGMAMQGILSSFTEKAANGNWGDDSYLVGTASVMFADAVLNALEEMKDS